VVNCVHTATGGETVNSFIAALDQKREAEAKIAAAEAKEKKAAS
jgi:hypothetical protein